MMKPKTKPKAKKTRKTKSAGQMLIEALTEVLEAEERNEKKISPKSKPVNVNEVFDEIENNRASGTLSSKVVKDEVWYEESKDNPGMLYRISVKGRELGTFKNGKFIVEPKKKNKRTK